MTAALDQLVAPIHQCKNFHCFRFGINDPILLHPVLLIQIPLLNPITVAPTQGNKYLWPSGLVRTLALPKARLSKRLLCSSDVLEYARRPADCKSAIQQITNLRYVTAAALRGSQAGWRAWARFVTCRGSPSTHPPPQNAMRWAWRVPGGMPGCFPDPVSVSMTLPCHDSVASPSDPGGSSE